MTNPEALFGVVPFGRVDFGVDWQGKAWLGWACHGKESGAERHGVAWQGLAGRGMESGTGWQCAVGLGLARLGAARHGMECG